MPASCRVRTVALTALALTAFASGGDVAADDGLPPLDAANAVRFTVPSTFRPAAAYQWIVAFGGPNEQNADLYVRAQQTNDTDRWQRRAFVNNYWQGGHCVSTLALEPGRTYAVCVHHKDGPAPGYGGAWRQSRLANVDPVADAPDTLPTVNATFAGASGVTTVTLRPLPKPAD